ncbi:MAG: hypothetical protein LUE27_05630 [Clostridia bacterium]|nr:hypothetical protein [Clostridia bacterium]
MVKVFVAVPVTTEEETDKRLRSALFTAVDAHPHQLIMMTNEPEDLQADWEKKLEEAEEAVLGAGWQDDGWCRVVHDEAKSIGRPALIEGTVETIEREEESI